jgi:hypothetical protein
MLGEDWIEGLKRIRTRIDLPITFQGGEPTLHKDFYKIANGVKWWGDGWNKCNLDLMTNATWSEGLFSEGISNQVFKRDAPYASIRVSYHPTQHNLDALLKKVKNLLDVGYHIGIWSVAYPSIEIKEAIEFAKEKAEALGIDFRIKEYLGEHSGTLYGKYKYQDACGHNKLREVKCKTTELLISPSGHIHRCHADLYGDRNPIGHILDKDFQIHDAYKLCDRYGMCNPCDIKIKTNRFQTDGHTSVDIKEL